MFGSLIFKNKNGQSPAVFMIEIKRLVEKHMANIYKRKFFGI
jgi:hypothetical protein